MSRIRNRAKGGPLPAYEQLLERKWNKLVEAVGGEIWWWGLALSEYF